MTSRALAIPPLELHRWRTIYQIQRASGGSTTGRLNGGGRRPDDAARPPSRPRR